MPRRLADRAGVSQSSAVRIRELQTGSPSDQAGLVAGDIIVALDAVPITGVDDLARLLDHSTIGRHVAITILRGETRQVCTVVPTDREAAG